VIASANATWIDRVEQHALRDANILNPYPACGEVFSASPLLGIIATLLAGDASHVTSLCSDWTGCASTVTLRVLANPVAPL
jgi:hypothetical protein